MLGTLGCIPAYDRFFIDGLKKYLNNDKVKYNGLLTINEKSLLFLFDFYKNNKKEINNTREEIKKITGFNYPVMKIVDMFFWSDGYKSFKEKYN